jgi:hypothetical protein
MSEFDLDELAVVINESSVTLGSGTRKRTIRSYEAIWIAADSHIRNGKRPNISAISNKSADDARLLLLDQVRAYLGL